MKKFYTALLIAACFFTACSDDEKKELFTVKIETGNYGFETSINTEQVNEKRIEAGTTVKLEAISNDDFLLEAALLDGSPVGTLTGLKWEYTIEGIDRDITITLSGKAYQDANSVIVRMETGEYDFTCWINGEETTEKVLPKGSSAVLRAQSGEEYYILEAELGGEPAGTVRSGYLWDGELENLQEPATIVLRGRSQNKDNPVYGSYYYADGSFSGPDGEFVEGKTPIGVVYRVVHSGNTYSGKVLSLSEKREVVWSTEMEYIIAEPNYPDNDKGDYNTDMIIDYIEKGVLSWENYPVMEYIRDERNEFGEDMYVPWYLPSRDELKELYAAYCGLLYRVDIADWSNSSMSPYMPGYMNYAPQRAYFNELLDAAGSAPLWEKDWDRCHWSSSEYDEEIVWSVWMEDGWVDWGFPKEVNYNTARLILKFEKAALN